MNADDLTCRVVTYVPDTSGGNDPYAESVRVRAAFGCGALRILAGDEVTVTMPAPASGNRLISDLRKGAASFDIPAVPMDGIVTFRGCTRSGEGVEASSFDVHDRGRRPSVAILLDAGTARLRPDAADEVPTTHVEELARRLAGQTWDGDAYRIVGIPSRDAPWLDPDVLEELRRTEAARLADASGWRVVGNAREYALWERDGVFLSTLGDLPSGTGGYSSAVAAAAIRGLHRDDVVPIGDGPEVRAVAYVEIDGQVSWQGLWRDPGAGWTSACADGHPLAFTDWRSAREGAVSDHERVAAEAPTAPTP